MSETEFEFDIPVEAQSELTGGPLTILTKLKAKAIGYIESTIERYRTEGLKLPTKEVFLAKASTLYDNLCAAIDIPRLSDRAEAALEQVMKPAFMRAAEFAYDSFTG